MERCEPRIISLYECANLLLDERSEIRTKLQEQKLRLQALRRLANIYILKLGSSLGIHPRDVDFSISSSSLATLSRDVSSSVIKTRFTQRFTSQSNCTYKAMQSQFIFGSFFIVSLVLSRFIIENLLFMLNLFHSV